MTECERAKNWLSENWKGDFWDEDVRSLMQFMREERARGWEGAAELANAMPMATSHNVAVRLKLVARRLREEP